jgi:hypothetical protein
MPYPRRCSGGISDIPLSHSHFTRMNWIWRMLNIIFQPQLMVKTIELRFYCILVWINSILFSLLPYKWNKSHHHHQPINAAGSQAFHGLPTRRTGHNPPRGPSADSWVLKTANTAGTNGLTWLPKHGGARGNKFFDHPSDDRPMLLSFRSYDKRTDRGAIELLKREL